MRSLCILLTICLLLFPTSCGKNSSNKVHQISDAQTAQRKPTHQVSTQDKCEMLADSIFGQKMISVNADDSNAILFEFKWLSSKDASKEQKIRCHFNR